MIYIILPIYNEAGVIKKVIGEVHQFLKGRPYRIIAVDDGSTDGTGKILDDLARGGLAKIEKTGYMVNMNIGSVFATGIDRALETARDDDVIIIMESDQTSSINVIDDLVEEIQKRRFDVVIASRYQPGGGYGNFPLSRRLFSIGANYLMRMYFPIAGISDYTIFFRGYRVGIIRKARTYFGKFGLIQSKGFVANAELLVKLSFLTKKITEVPFVYDYGKKTGKSKIDILKTINEYFVVTGYLKGILKKMV